MRRRYRRGVGGEPYCCGCSAVLVLGANWSDALKRQKRYACTSCVRAGSRRWNRNSRIEVLQRYGGICACCGESRYEFLAFDHIAGGGTQHRKGISNPRNFHVWLRNNGYPEGYRVLCHNCNFARGHYGVCPHEAERAVLKSA